MSDRAKQRGYLAAGVGAQRDHVHTHSVGCYCGSVFVGSSNDEPELLRLLREWSKLHPSGRSRDAVYHEHTTVAHARALRERRGQKSEASRIAVTDPRNLH